MLEGIEVFLVDALNQERIDSTTTNDAGAYAFSVEPNRPILIALDTSQSGISVIGESGYALKVYLFFFLLRCFSSLNWMS